MRIGVCGGGFGNAFLPFFAAHPDVKSVAIAELDPDRRGAMAAANPAARVCTSFDELCADPELDAIGIFTPPWLHAEHSLQALRSGKHVICAVPAALTLDELGQVVAEVERTGLYYMTAETSAYYPSFLYCRTRYARGDFGRFVYGDAQNICHPSNFPFWTRDFYATFPPMLYASHTVTMIVGVTGSRLTRVATAGFSGIHPSLDGLQRLEAFQDSNYSTESAFFRSDDLGSCRITEGRWVGNHAGSDGVFNLYGTEASFEERVGHQLWSTPDGVLDLTDQLQMYPSGQASRFGRWTAGRSPVFGSRELPEAFSQLRVQDARLELLLLAFAFLVDDFVRACTTGRRVFNDVWQGARYCAPGIVAHESAKRDGEWLEIPDFGSHPDGRWIADQLDRSAEEGTERN